MNKTDFFNYTCFLFVCFTVLFLVYIYNKNYQGFLSAKIHRYQRLNSFKHENKLKGSVLLLGDSQIEMFDYVDIFKSDKIILNHGISGEKSQELLKRLSVELTIEPNTIFIQTGINDMLNGYCKDEIILNYKNILKKIKTTNRTMSVYVISLYPLGKERPKLNETIMCLNQELSEICLQFKYGFINVHEKLLNSNGYLDTKYSTDGLHLNETGQIVLANIILEACPY